MYKFIQKNIFILLTGLFLLVNGNCFGAIEPFGKTIYGPFVNGVKDTIFDDKFQNPGVYPWANILNKTVQNNVSLRVVDNVLINYSFSYTVSIQIQYYTDPANNTPVTVNTSLTVNYAPGQGVTYKGLDSYSFQGGYKVIVTVTGTSGLPPPANAVQLTNSIVIDRSYLFQPTNSIGATYALASNNTQLNVSWLFIPGAEEYDVEWTTINNGNANFTTISNNLNTPSNPDVPAVSTALAQAFRNNASRATTSQQNFTISLISTDTYLLVRIRQAQYNKITGLRVTGNWDYKKRN